MENDLQLIIKGPLAQLQNFREQTKSVVCIDNEVKFTIPRDLK